MVNDLKRSSESLGVKMECIPNHSEISVCENFFRPPKFGARSRPMLVSIAVYFCCDMESTQFGCPCLMHEIRYLTMARSSGPIVYRRQQIGTDSMFLQKPPMVHVCHLLR